MSLKREFANDGAPGQLGVRDHAITANEKGQGTPKLTSFMHIQARRLIPSSGR